MNRRAWIAAALALLAVSATHAPAAAAERVTVAVANFGNIAFLPYDAAAVLGYFGDEGLDVDSQYFRSGSHAAAALLGGSADFGAVTFDHAVKAHIQGKSLTMLASFSEVPGMQVLVRNELRDTVKDLRDLKGRPVGVTGLNAATHMVLNYVLTRAGLELAEINAIPVGGQGMAAAIENARVDGIITNVLPTTKLVEAGRGFVLLDLMARDQTEKIFGGPYVDTGLLTRREVIEQRPEVCLKLVRAIVRANRWIATHTPEEIAAALPEEMVKDRSLYAKALAKAKDGYSRDGRVDPRAVDTVIGAHRAFGRIPADRRVDAASLYDNGFVEQAGAGGS